MRDGGGLVELLFIGIVMFGVTCGVAEERDKARKQLCAERFARAQTASDSLRVLQDTTGFKCPTHPRTD